MSFMMRVISEKDKIALKDLKKLSQEGFGNLIKAVVDVEKEIIVVGGELHADEEALLLQQGSKQDNLWGINIYPEVTGSDWVEFDSMINLRPRQGNLSREVDNPKIREKILEILGKLIEK